MDQVEVQKLKGFSMALQEVQFLLRMDKKIKRRMEKVKVIVANDEHTNLLLEKECECKVTPL